MMWLTDPSGWAAFLTLLTLELVLGVDNIIVIAILTSRLPMPAQASQAALRRQGV
jgi:predicted tellurium resistance membrane protein TerC